MVLFRQPCFGVLLSKFGGSSRTNKGAFLSALWRSTLTVPAARGAYRVLPQLLLLFFVTKGRRRLCTAGGLFLGTRETVKHARPAKLYHVIDVLGRRIRDQANIVEVDFPHKKSRQMFCVLGGGDHGENLSPVGIADPNLIERLFQPLAPS